MITLNKLKRGLSVSCMVSALALLSACSNGWKVDQVKEAQATGTPFTMALHKNYVELVKGEANQEDWTSADYFARKGLRAAGGEQVTPENASDWGVAEDKIGDLNNMHAKLVDLIGKRADKRPDIAAIAQVSFDCVVEQLGKTEGHQLAHIKKCRDTYLAAIAALESPLQKNFVLYFDFGSSRVNKTAMEEVKKIAEASGQYPDWFLHIEGHADTVASQTYNTRLSQKRADNVRYVLKRHGVEHQRMYTTGHGELQLAVPTPDSTKEQANRRVEVTLTEQR